MLPPDTCDVPDDVCCTTLYDVAYYLLTQVHEAVSACYPSGVPCACTPLAAYVSHGLNGDDGVSDSLMVAVVNTIPSPASQDAAGRTVGYALFRTTFRVMLRESGWPMVFAQGTDVYAPDPVRQNKLAKHSYAHGEMMYRKLNSMRLARTMAPSEMPQPSIAFFGPLVPMPPAGGTVGWYADIQLDMIWR